MQLGMIGLGKMGGNMRQRLRDAGHEVVGYDRNPEVTDVASLGELAARLSSRPRVVWLMLPIQAVDATIGELVPLLSAGDIVIEGGNSKYTRDHVRAEQLGALGIRFLDVGTTGGATAPATSRRWSTTASSTPSCRPMPRAGSCWRRRPRRRMLRHQFGGHALKADGARPS